MCIQISTEHSCGCHGPTQMQYCLKAERGQGCEYLLPRRKLTKLQIPCPNHGMSQFTHPALRTKPPPSAYYNSSRNPSQRPQTAPHDTVQFFPPRTSSRYPPPRSSSLRTNTTVTLPHPTPGIPPRRSPRFANFPPTRSQSTRQRHQDKPLPHLPNHPVLSPRNQAFPRVTRQSTAPPPPPAPRRRAASSPESDVYRAVADRVRSNLSHRPRRLDEQAKERGRRQLQKAAEEERARRNDIERLAGTRDASGRRIRQRSEKGCQVM